MNIFDGSITYTKSGSQRANVNKYRSDNGAGILMNLCQDLEIPRFSWVVFSVTGYDMNSLSDNYCYYGIFYYNGINDIRSIILQKIAGTASITATNAMGTIASTFDSGVPLLNIEVINWF